MNLGELTPEEKRNLVTRDGRPAKIVDVLGEDTFLVKANLYKYPYRVNSEGRSIPVRSAESPDDIVLTNLRKIRVLLYEDGTSSWHYVGERPSQSSKTIIHVIKGEM